MITAHNALSTRRRGSNRAGKNDPTRTFGTLSTSPAGVDRGSWCGHRYANSTVYRNVHDVRRRSG